MNYVNGLVYGAGFTTGAFIVVVVLRALFHVGLCG
jgi:uncharacterized protein (DUF2235 family)